MTKRRSSWSGPKSEEWDFGPFIEEDNLFLDPEIDCHVDFRIQRAANRKGIFAGLGLWKDVKIPKVIECDDNNESPNGDDDNDDIPLLETNQLALDMKSLRRCDNDREANETGWQPLSPHGEMTRRLESKSEHRRMFPYDISVQKKPIESKSEHRRSAPIEHPQNVMKKRLKSKSEHQRMIPIDIDVDATDLASLKQRKAQVKQKNAQNAGGDAIPSTLEIDFERKLQFLAEDKPEAELESRVQPIQLHTLSIIESDALDVVQMWELDPEDDDSFANEIDSMPLDMPPESPFLEDHAASPRHDVLPRSSMREDSCQRRNPGVAGRNALYELRRERSIHSLECGRMSVSSPLRTSERSRHSVKLSEKVRRSPKHDQGTDRSCSSRPEISLNRSSCHDCRSPSLNSSQHNPNAQSMHVSAFRENHGSQVGMRDVSHRGVQRERSPRGDHRSQTSSGPSHGQETDRSNDSERKYQPEQSERRQRSGSSTNSASIEEPKSSLSARQSQLINKQVQGQIQAGMMMTPVDSTSSHRSRSSGTSPKSQSSRRKGQLLQGMEALDSASYHRSGPSSTRQGQLPQAGGLLDSASYHRSGPNTSSLTSKSQHRSSPVSRGPEGELRRGRQESSESESRRTRASSVPKNRLVITTRDEPRLVYSSVTANPRVGNNIYRKPLDDGIRSNSNTTTAANRLSQFHRQPARTKKEMSKKSYMDTVFGAGSHSYHGVSSCTTTPYKSAPAG